MKVKLNLRDILADNRAGFAGVMVTVDLDDRIQCTNVSAWPKFDLFEILEDNRMIAHVWTISDVHETRPDLTDDQAWEVLKACFRDLDSRDGITWDTIKTAAEKLFGASINRPMRFRKVVEVYTDDDVRTNFVDLLADGLHWAAANSVDFAQALSVARNRFAAETTKGDQL